MWLNHRLLNDLLLLAVANVIASPPLTHTDVSPRCVSSRVFFLLPPNGDDPQRYFCSAAAPMRFPFSCEDAVCAHSWIYSTLLHSKHNPERRAEERRGGEEQGKEGGREGGRQGGGGESSYERSSAPWRALVRLDAGRPQVDGSVCTWGGGGSVGMWGDQNDVISKACSIWLDSVVLIPSNPVNARSLERNWRIICKSCTVCLSGDLQESHTSQKKKKKAFYFSYPMWEVNWRWCSYIT